MKLLVTGASGFIGRNFLKSVPAEWDITATYNTSFDFPEFLRLQVPAPVVPLRLDLTNPGAAAAVRIQSGHYDACLFLLANGDPALSVSRPAFDLRSNTIALLELLEAITFDKFVYFSSGAVYDGLKGPVSPRTSISPHLPYAISKLTSERYLERFAEIHRVKSLTIVRFFGAYGPFEAPRKIYGRLVRQFGLIRDPRFTVRGNGRNLIDAMFIDDAVRAIRYLLSNQEPDGTIDLSCGNPLTVSELVQQAAVVFGLEPQVTFEGHVQEYIEFFSTDQSMSNRHGFRPEIGLKDGLRRFAAYLKQLEQ